ncbi:hypothetical protein BsWGS_27110 [Bradybaena similaris]
MTQYDEMITLSKTWTLQMTWSSSVPQAKTSRTKTNHLQNFAQQLGLQINTAKTKVMDFINPNIVIKLGNKSLQAVSSFTYLGSKMTSDVNTELATRIGRYLSHTHAYT